MNKTPGESHLAEASSAQSGFLKFLEYLRAGDIEKAYKFKNN